jgi:hypothetical protein
MPLSGHSIAEALKTLLDDLAPPCPCATRRCPACASTVKGTPTADCALCKNRRVAPPEPLCVQCRGRGLHHGGVDVHEVMLAIEARELVPEGWGSDPLRVWDASESVAHVRWLDIRSAKEQLTSEALHGFSLSVGSSTAMWPAREVTLTRGEYTRTAESLPGEGVHEALRALASRWPEPATTAHLLAVVSLGWGLAPRAVRCSCGESTRSTSSPGAAPCAQCGGSGVRHIPRGHDRAEELARRAVAALRAHGRSARSPESMCVVWRVATPQSVRSFQTIRPGRVERPAEAEGPHEHTPAARALRDMGLRLGRITDDSVTVEVQPLETSQRSGERV